MQPELVDVANVVDQTWMDICSSRDCSHANFPKTTTPPPTGPLWPQCSCWDSVLSNIHHNERWHALAKPGFFPGADYLIVGPYSARECAQPWH